MLDPGSLRLGLIANEFKDNQYFKKKQMDSIFSGSPDDADYTIITIFSFTYSPPDYYIYITST